MTRHLASRIVILTGPSRAGKTTVCRTVIAEADARGLGVAGALTTDGVADDGSRLQYVVDLRSGERRLLAAALGPSAVPRGLEAPAGREPLPALAGAPTGGWRFEEDGVAFGRAILEACVRAPCDLLVIDQIGPLELLEGRGWTVAFDVLARGRFGLALVVVNPRVIDLARQAIGACDVCAVDTAGRDVLPARLGALLPQPPG
jgi:nucleoside-triphosphatase THEP1